MAEIGVLAAVSVNCFGAIAFKQTTQVDNAGSTSTPSLAFTASTGGSAASTVLLAGLGWSSSSVACNATCVTDTQTNTWTCESRHTLSGAGWSSTLCWTAVTGAGGADTITAHLASAVSEQLIYVAEYQGVAGGIDGHCSATALSCTFSAAASGDMLFGFGIDSNTSGAGSGWTARNTSFSNILEEKASAGSGTQTITVTGLGGTDTDVYGVALSPSGAAPANAPRGLLPLSGVGK